jgi:glycosyltransferase involved in cell wall biosynthesis
LHRRHEVHYAALNNPGNREGPGRSSEYAARHVAVEHAPPARASLSMVPQLIGSFLSPVPLAVSRYSSRPLRRKIKDLVASEGYDVIVCDFLASAPNIPELGDCVLFQHNVETTIWERHAAQANSPIKKRFFQLQAKKMESYERRVCRESKRVIAVSEIDALRMRRMFGIEDAASIPTGVDLDYFAPTGGESYKTDLVFCGSMDWLPNVDAMVYFLSEVWPMIRRDRPDATVTIAGRSPDAAILKAAEGVAGVSLTGTVPDIRPYLWGAKASIVPIRIGGGTRLKIYECMAAGVPVISTQVGAEGLAYTNGENIVLADEPSAFAGECLRLLGDKDARDAIARNALALVREKFSWAAVAGEFEAILRSESGG